MENYYLHTLTILRLLEMDTNYKISFRCFKPESNACALIAYGIGYVSSRYLDLFIDDSSFSWDILVTESNILSIMFDKVLVEALEGKDLQISFSKSINLGFSSIPVTNSSYNISIVLDETIPRGTEITF